jgi:phage replication O-like protein O
MTSPQLEEGFTRIANELFEAILHYKFSQRQLLVLLTILRKTYGYAKKEDDMSASQIGELCNISRNHVTETIGQLVNLNVITKRAGKYGLILGVNKSHATWVEQAKAVPSPDLGLPVPPLVLVPNQDITSPKSGQVDSPKSGHTKENLSKETKQKKAARPDVLFDAWLAETKAAGQKPIPEDHSVFNYAEKVGLPLDFIRLCWLEFKATFTGNTKKKYADWPAAFSNYVRKNYFKLWYPKGDEWLLTTAGVQLQKEMKAA